MPKNLLDWMALGLLLFVAIRIVDNYEIQGFEQAAERWFH
jgi:hypothetical protein